MSTNEPCHRDSDLNDSWVDLSNEKYKSRVATPPMTVGPMTNFERLLWEAQRESNHSSLIGSSASSRHSPVMLSSLNTELKDHNQQLSNAADWIWDWSSRPDQHPPKEWKFKHPPPKKILSVRNTKVGKSGFFSAEILSIFFLTNLISLFIGTGIGMFIAKKFNMVYFVAQN